MAIFLFDSITGRRLITSHPDQGRYIFCYSSSHTGTCLLDVEIQAGVITHHIDDLISHVYVYVDQYLFLPYNETLYKSMHVLTGVSRWEDVQAGIRVLENLCETVEAQQKRIELLEDIIDHPDGIGAKYSYNEIQRALE